MAGTPQERVCTRCVMDTSVPDIRFDGDGVCNYCTDYLICRYSPPGNVDGRRVI